MKAIVRNGRLTFVAHSNDTHIVTQAGDATWQRGGHVVPASPLKRVIFRLVRSWLPFAPVIQWTRDWRGGWVVDLTVSQGPVMGPYATRREAIETEETWLATKLAGRVQPVLPTSRMQEIASQYLQLTTGNS